MKTNAQPSVPIGVVPTGTRSVAIVTGCITAVACCLSAGFLFIIVPAILVWGAVVQPRSARLGRRLMCLGAILLALILIPLSFRVLWTGIPQLRLYHDAGIVGILSVWLLSFLFVIWCDALLLIDARK
jgi:hypothetical protein